MQVLIFSFPLQCPILRTYLNLLFIWYVDLIRFILFTFFRWCPYKRSIGERLEKLLVLYISTESRWFLRRCFKFKRFKPHQKWRNVTIYALELFILSLHTRYRSKTYTLTCWWRIIFQLTTTFPQMKRHKSVSILLIFLRKIFSVSALLRSTVQTVSFKSC